MFLVVALLCMAGDTCIPWNAAILVNPKDICDTSLKCSLCIILYVTFFLLFMYLYMYIFIMQNLFVIYKKIVILYKYFTRKMTMYFIFIPQYQYVSTNPYTFTNNIICFRNACFTCYIVFWTRNKYAPEHQWHLFVIKISLKKHHFCKNSIWH